MFGARRFVNFEFSLKYLKIIPSMCDTIRTVRTVILWTIFHILILLYIIIIIACSLPNNLALIPIGDENFELFLLFLVYLFYFSLIVSLRVCDSSPSSCLVWSNGEGLPPSSLLSLIRLLILLNKYTPSSPSPLSISAFCSLLMIMMMMMMGRRRRPSILDQEK